MHSLLQRLLIHDSISLAKLLAKKVLNIQFKVIIQLITSKHLLSNILGRMDDTLKKHNALDSKNTNKPHHHSMEMTASKF